MNKTKIPISREVALQVCNEIRQQYKGMWWTLPGMQCLGCTTASKGDLKKMCLSGAPGYCGCNLVNKRYDDNKPSPKGKMDGVVIASDQAS